MKWVGTAVLERLGEGAHRESPPRAGILRGMGSLADVKAWRGIEWRQVLGSRESYEVRFGLRRLVRYHQEVWLRPDAGCSDEFRGVSTEHGEAPLG